LIPGGVPTVTVAVAVLIFGLVGVPVIVAVPVASEVTWKEAEV
jgi:hypothetical protein